MFTTAAIALGGNVGHVPQVFLRALALLDLLPEVQLVGRSRNFETHPMGEQAGGTFINSVALLQTSLTPSELLHQVQHVEREFGRERTVSWGPRTLDIDLLSFGQGIVVLDAAGQPDPACGSATVHHHPMSSYRGTLLIPHPGCWYRRFVLDPWCDVSPHWRHPVLGETVREMQQRLRKLPLAVAVVGGSAHTREQLLKAIETRHLDSQVAVIGEEEETVADLTFQFGNGSTPCRPIARSILLQDSLTGVRMALTTLQAALDQPVPCSSS